MKRLGVFLVSIAAVNVGVIVCWLIADSAILAWYWIRHGHFSNAIAPLAMMAFWCFVIGVILILATTKDRGREGHVK